MKIIRRVITSIHILGLLLLVPLSVFAQAESQSGKSTIKIRAIYDDNERPVRRAEVSLESEEVPRMIRRGVTNSKGELKFSNVPQGSFVISVGYSLVTRGSSGIASKSSLVVDGTSSSELTMRVKRAAVVTGKVSYPDGEPVIGAKVLAIAKQGKRWSAFLEAAKTDDRGIYRIYPLAEGEYIISAYEEGMVVMDHPEGGDIQTTTNLSLRPYYYGGTNEFKAAQILSLEAGRELTNINITLSERAVHKVSGTVLGAGEPLPGASLTLRAREEAEGEQIGGMSPFGTSTHADKKGVWSFGEVPEGNYVIELMSESSSFSPSPNRVGRRFAWQPLPVTVTNSDIENIVLTAAEGAKVSGTVVVDGEKPLPGAEIFLRQTGALRSMFSRNTTQLDRSSKGEFKIDGVAAGEHFLIMNVWDRNYYVKSMTWKERDLLRFPLTLAEGAEIKGVRIILSTDISDVKGRLLYADNKPAGPNVIRLLPVDESLWNTSPFRGMLTDNQGRFRHQGAPGEYALIVIPKGQEPNLSQRELGEQLKAAPRVNLRAGEQQLNDIIVPAP